MKRIITAAITGGIHTPAMSPYLPITPKQIAEEAVRAYEVGAAVAHIHARDPETGRPIANMDYFGEIAAYVKSRCDMILCFTTGGGMGMTTEERIKVVQTLEPELASCNSGSLNFALFHVLDHMEHFKHDWEKDYLAASEDIIFPNTFKTLREYTEEFDHCNTKPELEIYDIGMINNVAFMVNKEHLKKPVYLQFVMGILGGIQPTVDNLLYMYNTAKELIGNFEWSVCAAGKNQIKMCNMALLMGGHARVGLEDNLYLEKGQLAKSNAEQVEKIVRIAGELGIEPATPNEAREILGLKGLDRVKY
ncbi:3-keto-5-aminohexanoate cleavage protein [Metallumcola ferriviriculae]|uniref:3-keto-5-aminohexanoate cleavage protein n=1 Tax=Metallumcola ferriviriculae TaxID=3039180 RepID=A0AAU0ULT3_9FIRM|nr:3-keto-5-aminohexanoate cleavage protein [Desulfitibacteraceae bacterium MK1]